MKALTLSQPWASAIALGYKCIETRGWKPKNPPKRIVIASSNKVMTESQRRTAQSLLPGVEDFPRRSLLAVVSLEAFVPTEEIRDSLGHMERKLGDYSDGRWAWRIGRVDPLPEPIEMYPVSPKPGAKPRLPGNLSLWRLPAEFEAKVLAAAL